MDEREIIAAFADVVDHALVFHGYAKHMRDYDVFVLVTADPRTGIAAEHLRFRFTHCVRATATTAVPAQVWARSLDDRLIEFERGRDLDGYVWGVDHQVLYPGMKLVPGSAEAQQWADALGLPFHEASIETNGNDLSLVFSDLVVERVEPGFAPFVVP